MGLSLSLLSSASAELIGNKVFVLAEDVEAILAKSFSFGETDVNMALRSISFKNMDTETLLSPSRPGKIVFERSLSFRSWEPVNTKLETVDSSKTPNMEVDKAGSFELESTVDEAVPKLEPAKCFPQLVSPRSISELDAAAVKLQKVYKSYRTRRNLADCAVVVEELWWKALDFASLKQSSVSFFNVEKPETAVSRWSRARTRVAKVGKGLSKDDKAQKLALQHWLEAIDPRHRYGHNLHLYYDIWFINESSQPFFYWLDVGDGKEVNLEKCPRSSLQQQCIKYLGPKEREAYEVIVECGKLVYKQSETLVDTVEGSKWIFVLSTTRDLYVGQKKKGKFQHSSFLAGGATTAAGRLVAKDGVLKAIWPYSGHYHPTEENFEVFISFLKDNDVNLTEVKRCSIDDDEFPSFHKTDEVAVEVTEGPATEATDISRTESEEPPTESSELEAHVENDMEKDDAPRFDIGKRLSCKWTTGTGPRIGCVRDYPTELQFKALEQVNLSPRVIPSPMGNKCPIPSPRPSPRVRLSPRLQYMGIPSPTVSLTLPKPKKC